MLTKSDSCDDGVVRTYEIIRPILSKQTARQKIEIDEYKNFGVGIWIDGWPQCAESDTDKYHQALIHPALITRTSPFSVVIMGGGDFGAASELVKYPNLSRVHIVDWDLEFIDITKEHLSPIHKGSWQDPRVTVEKENPDIFEYFKNSTEKFDYIIGDLTDLNAMDDTFPDFMNQIRGLMSQNGTFISQFSEYPTTKPALKTFSALVEKVSSAFKNLWIYKTYIPSFGYEQAYLIATDSNAYNPKTVPAHEICDGIRRLRGECLEYSAEVHASYFALPPSIKRYIPNN